MGSLLQSLGEFCKLVSRRWYAMVVGVIGGLLGLASAVYADVQKVPPEGPPPPPLVPVWLWLTLLVGGFLAAIIWAFHDVRMERDALKSEIERRFTALRYALQRSGLDFNLELSPDGTWRVEAGLRLVNNSDEYLRYEIDHMAVVLQSRSVENPQFLNRGVIIPPHGTDVFRYPFISGVPSGWQTGSVEFTVRYGHPSAPLRFRKSEKLRLRASQLLGQPPPKNLHVAADLVDDPEVEDI